MKRASLDRHTPYFEMLEALGQPGCAVCRLGARAVTRYLNSLSYETVNDVDLRATIREALGLCNHHAWQFVTETRELLGTAIIYRDLIRTLQRRTREQPSQSALIPRGGCVTCAALRTAITDGAELLAASWPDPALREAAAASDGLCWNHLVAVLSASRAAARRRDVVEVQRAAWDRRIARARREGQPHLLLEALASAPGMIGARAQPSANAPPASGDADLAEDAPEVKLGHCPVCAAVADRLAHRRPEVAVGASCPAHAWLSASRLSAVDVDSLVGRLKDLDRRLVSLIEKDSDGPALLRWTRRYRRGWEWVSETVAEADCSACREQRDQEIALIARAGPSTLCVPHLRLAALHHPDVDALMFQTRRTWRAIEVQLDEYIRKHDYRFNHEPLGEEKEAPSWAVELVAGLDGVR